MNVIGIVGPLACGKGVVADYLIKNYSYISFSLSTIVHDELKKRGITRFDRTVLQDIGDELRKKEGNNVLAKRAVETLRVTRSTVDESRIIIEGIRNPGEVEYLRAIPGFFLIAVDAPQKIRFARVLKRGKVWDPKDWESFLTVDGRDSGDTTNTLGQQVRKCMEIADVTIQNNGDIKDIYKKIEALLQQNNPLTR